MRTRIIAAGGLAVLMFVLGAVLMSFGGLSEARKRGSLPTIATAEAAAVTDIDAVITAIQDRVRAGDANVSDWTALGSAYLDKARATADPAYYRLAGKSLSRALRLAPTNLPALLGMGQLALGRHDFASARRLGSRALNVDPYNSTAYGIIGDAEVELGRYGDAFRSYQRMVDLRPSLSSYARVSYARELTGDVAGAVAAMTNAIEAGASAADTAWAHNQLGDLYFNSGRLGAAERAYLTALALAPDFVPPDAGLGRVEAARGFYRSAIRRYDAIVDRHPLPQYVSALGDLYAARGRTGDSRRQYELVMVQRDLFEAAGVLPDVEITLFLADHGSDPRAAVRLARAQYADRPSVRVADALAWSLYRSGAYVAAQEFSTAALKLGTQDASYHFHAGMIAKALGDREAARRHLAQALAINPHFSIRESDPARRALTAVGGRP